MDREDLLKLIEVMNSLDFTISDKWQRSKLHEMKVILNKEIANHIFKQRLLVDSRDDDLLESAAKSANRDYEYEYGVM